MMKVPVPYNQREIIQVFWPQAPAGVMQIAAWKRYAFQFNAAVDCTRCYMLRWYLPESLVPLTFVLNGQICFQNNSPETLCVSFAKRGGGYYCIDRPLTSFMVNGSGSNGHYEFQVDNWELDTTNSYIKSNISIDGAFGYNLATQIELFLRPN